MDVWTEVASARMLLADEVDRLDQSALDAPSWCGSWRVRDVLGHLVHLAEATQLSALGDVVRLGPAPDRASDRRARMLGELPAEDLTRRLRAAAGGRFHVPGTPAIVALGEVLVHGADMFRPLGLEFDADPAKVSPLLAVYRRVGRLAFHAAPARQVTLVATDADVTLGKGPEVRGRAIDLLLLLANRSQVAPALSGPGVDMLRLGPA